MTLAMRSLSGPYNGLAEKVKFIRRCYDESLKDPRVRAWAEEKAGRGTRVEQARNLWRALREVMVYTPDPVGVEYTKSPSRHLDDILSKGRAYGDCDDHACVGFAMLQSIGIPAKLRVTWHGKAVPQHIYLAAYINGGAVPFDTTRLSGFGRDVAFTKVMDL